MAPGAPRCPRVSLVGVWERAEGSCRAPGNPTGGGAGGYGNRKSFKEKICEPKNEKMQKVRSGEIPQGCRYMETCG